MRGNVPARPGAGGPGLRRLALVLLLLMLLVTSASAWLRLLGQPRAPCADWPACRSAAAAAVLPAAAEPGPAPRATVEGVRLVHRFAATAALLGIIVALVALLRRPRAERDPIALRWAMVLLALALALSALGVVTPASRSPLVLLGNLLGGLMMVGAASRLWTQIEARPPLPLPLLRQARWLLVLWFAQVALGALSGAAALHLAPPLHLMVAMAALPWAFALGTWAWRSGHAGAGGWLLGAALLQLLLGIWAANAAAGATAVLAHNLGAAFSVAALAALR